MAFNPFHTFRKHQKVLFAALTIMCMITFILTGSLTGRGDFFDWVRTSLGGEGRYAQVATLYGRRIDTQEIQVLREHRTMANEYMAAAMQRAFSNLGESVEKALQKGGMQIPRQQLFQALFQDKLEGLRRQLESTGKKDEATLLRLYAAAFEQSFRQGLHFGGNFEVESLLDFMIWRHQADRLGITLTPADVGREVRRDTFGAFSLENSIEVQNQILRMHQATGRTVQDLQDALNDEFRVRLAQAALLGYEPGSPSRVPAPVTPYEFYDFYKHNRTDVTVAVLPIPVETFVADVKETPGEGELEKLFEEHKNKEYAPESQTPGFKQPRRVQIEWASGRADTPHYKKAAENVAAALEATLPLPFEGLMLDEYDMTKRVYFQNPSWTESWNGPVFPLHDSSIYQPAALAATIGEVLGSGAAQAGIFPPLGALEGAAVVREMRERVRIGAEILGAALDPLPFAALVRALRHTPKDEFLPLKDVRDRVRERVKERIAQDLLAGNLNAVKKELDSLKSRPEKVRKEEARKYLAHAYVRYGFKHGATTKPRDQYDVAADSGIEPLKEAYLQQRREDPRAKQFGRLPFSQAKLFEAERYPVSFQSAGDDPTWKQATEPLLYWKTSDEKAYVPEFAQVKDQVLQAWRFNKARALAQKHAEEIAEKVRKSKADPTPIFLDSSKDPGKLFNLYLIARLQPRRTAVFGGANQYEPYRVPDDKIEYPPPDFVDKVQGLKDKGDVVVLSDRPQANSYVVGLLNRIEPSLQEFHLRYKDAPPGTFQDTLYAMFEQEQRAKYQQAFVAQLREDAKLSINEDALKRQREGTAQGEE